MNDECTEYAIGYVRSPKSPAAKKTYPWYTPLTWPQYIAKVIEDVKAEKARIGAKKFTPEELNGLDSTLAMKFNNPGYY